jgi:hypothetical protein
MEAVRRAFPGQKFAIDVVSRAFGRPDPAERSQQDPSACGITSENRVDLEQAQNAGKSCAQQESSTCGIRGPDAAEKQLDSEKAERAGQRSEAPPAPTDVGGEAAGGWKRRYGSVDLQSPLHIPCLLDLLLGAPGCGTSPISVFSRPVYVHK